MRFDFKLLLNVLIMFVFSANIAFSNDIDNLIENSSVGKNAIVAVSVKDVKTGKTIYGYNQNKFLNPASILKVFTVRSAISQLGYDYVFETVAYSDEKNNLYIKLTGDPTFTDAQLKILLSDVKARSSKPFNDVVLDANLQDNKQWGIGWMWDDDVSALLPKYSPFSINQNKVWVTILPGAQGKSPSIQYNSPYKMQFVNNLKNGAKNSVTLERSPWKTSDTTSFNGTVNTKIHVQLPVNSPEKHFISILNKTMSDIGLKYGGDIKIAPITANVSKISGVSSEPLEFIVSEILKNSNNFYSEMVFIKGGALYAKDVGSTENAIKMFESYYSDLKSPKPLVVDACGISRNNLISADWVTSALNKISKESDFSRFETLLPKPMEGTLSDRLLNISLKLRAKTGTASNISSLVGYIVAKNNRKYSFAIMIQGHNSPVKDVKIFEDKLVNEIYKM